MPWVLSPYHLIVLSYALVVAMASLGVNLLLGYTGLLSLGHAAFFGAGAYTGGFIYTFFSLTSVEAYLLFGLVAATALAALTGFLCVQATKIYFTILTLAFAQIIHSLFISGAVFELAGLEGRGLFILGGGGLVIPRFTILGSELPPERFYTALYFLIAFAFALCIGATWVIVNSPFGKALQAIRDDDVRAACIGIRLRTYRWAAFVLSAVIAGLAGGLFGQLDRQITPAQLHWLFSAKLVLAAVLGGHRIFLGPVIGALVLTGLQEFALRYTGYHGLILGLLLITVVLLFPGGLTGGALRCLARLHLGLSSSPNPPPPRPPI
jgi:branched-chain amino acid transport system permease protein